MPALRSCSSTRSLPKKSVSPRPRRHGSPNRSVRALPPRAPRRRSRQRRKPTPGLPSRRASRLKRPSRSRRIRPPRPSKSASRREAPCRQGARRDKPVNLAALDAGPPQAGITKSVQAELRRVGCLTGAADGNWNTASQRSLTLFNRYAGTKLDAKVASVDTLDAIKLKPSRVCPLVCERGFKADGDRCSKITCAEGSLLNDDNECEKRRARKPVASREEDDRPVRSERPVRERPRPDAGAAGARIGQGAAQAGQGSGQVVCGETGCRGVTRGCHLEYRTFEKGGPYPSGGNIEICR